MPLATSTVLAATAIGLGAAGTAVEYKGQSEAIDASKRAEVLRKRQMDLEADREKKQSLRQALVARSLAVSNATTQGAQASSGLAGGEAQVQGQYNTNINAVNQSQEIGAGLFAANEQEAQGKGLAALGGAFQGVSGQIINNLPTLTRIGSYFSRIQ